jgi:GT2 family glycosyltransferase
LIEDNSPDNSLEVCRELAEKYEKVRLLRHPDGGNHGAGASRNLGMQHARYEYIGFVDADNFYLPGRFTRTEQVFAEHPDCEGVYEAIGIHAENEKALERWQASGRHPVDQLITVSNGIEPDQLGMELIKGNQGSLTLDGLVIRRDLLAKVGLMATQLKLHQDTEFILRCALSGRLFPGSLDQAVAMEGVHENNRFSAPKSQAREYRNRMAGWMSLYRWAKVHARPLEVQQIRTSILQYTRSHKYFTRFPRHLFPTRLVWGTRMLRLFIYPEVLVDSLLVPKPKLVKPSSEKSS